MHSDNLNCDLLQLFFYFKNCFSFYINLNVKTAKKIFTILNILWNTK